MAATPGHGLLDESLQGIHKPYQRYFADLDTAEAYTLFNATDVGKLIRVGNALYLIVDDSPLTYQPIGGAGIGGFPFTVITVDLADEQADFPTITAAYEAGLSPNDVILVGPGTYEADELEWPEDVALVGLGESVTIIINAEDTTEYLFGLTGVTHKCQGIKFMSTAGTAPTDASIFKNLDAGGSTIDLHDCIGDIREESGNDTSVFNGGAAGGIQARLYGGAYIVESDGVGTLGNDTSVSFDMYNLPRINTNDGLGTITAAGFYTNTDTALISANAGVGIVEFSDDITLVGDESDVVPTEHAVKTYVDRNRTLSIITTTVGNVGAGIDTLMTFTVPANALAVNGESLEIEAVVQYAVNANNKQVWLKFGATNVYNSGQQPENGGTIIIRARIIRVGTTSQKCYSVVTTSKMVLVDDYATYVTAAETLSGTVVVQVVAEAVATDDIIQQTLVVRKVSA